MEAIETAYRPLAVRSQLYVLGQTLTLFHSVSSFTGSFRFRIMVAVLINMSNGQCHGLIVFAILPIKQPGHCSI